MFEKGMSEWDIDAAGFTAMTYEEFVQKYAKEHPPSPEQLEDINKNRENRIRGIRQAYDVRAYHN